MTGKVSFKYFTSTDNLNLAWERLILSGDALYKNYFRDHYKTYSLSLAKNIQRLSWALQQNTWEPTSPSYVYFPKKSGLLRKYTLLTVEDQIVYQALANVASIKALPRLSRYYNKKTFSNQLNPKSNGPFYLEYRMGYAKFNQAIVRSFSSGKKYAVDFDLTSFFDSIDHHVLEQSLEHLKIPIELSDFLMRVLKKWTEAEVKSAVLSQKHGIPQGPLSSAFFAELILHRFDKLFETESKIKYLRYVDDIRLMASSESEVRKELIRLDFVSKMLGLFPQSSKVNVRKITDIKSEIKTISEIVVFDPDDVKEQENLVDNIKQLTPRLNILNESKLRYALGQCQPHTEMNSRVVKLLVKHPHLYQIFLNYLAKTKFLNKSQSNSLFNFLGQDVQYYSVTAQIVDFLRQHGHESIKNKLTKFCTRRQLGKGKNYSELIFSLTCQRLVSHSISWGDFVKIVARTKDWWSLSRLIYCVDVYDFGSPTVDTFLFKMMSESNGEISLAAAAKFIEEDFDLNRRSTANLSPKAQVLLREHNKISAVRSRHCYLKSSIDEMIMNMQTRYVWKRFLANHYEKSLRLVQRWKAYRRTDPTAWINMTDVFFDLLLDRLYAKEPSLGTYQLGVIGGVLGAPKGRLATRYPKTYTAASKVHELRLSSDLSHAKVRRTKRYTRYISHREARSIVKLLRSAFSELFHKGHLT